MYVLASSTPLCIAKFGFQGPLWPIQSRARSPQDLLGAHVWPTGALGEGLGKRVWSTGALGEVPGYACTRFVGPRRALETEFSDPKGNA